MEPGQAQRIAVNFTPAALAKKITGFFWTTTPRPCAFWESSSTNRATATQLPRWERACWLGAAVRTCGSASAERYGQRQGRVFIHRIGGSLTAHVASALAGILNVDFHSRQSSPDADATTRKHCRAIPSVSRREGHQDRHGVPRAWEVASDARLDLPPSEPHSWIGVRCRCHRQ